MSHLERKYGIREKGFNLGMEQIKQRILAKSNKMKRTLHNLSKTECLHPIKISFTGIFAEIQWKR